MRLRGDITARNIHAQVLHGWGGIGCGWLSWAGMILRGEVAALEGIVVPVG